MQNKDEHKKKKKKVYKEKEVEKEEFLMELQGFGREGRRPVTESGSLESNNKMALLLSVGSLLACF